MSASVYLPMLRQGSAITSSTVMYATSQPDRIHEAVVAVERDQARDAEERRGGQIVASDRPAVLQSRHAAARGVEIGGALDALGGEVRHEHRQRR